jgi:chemotaxis protein histidine kinase CheA
MNDECTRLNEARTAIRARGLDSGTRDALFRAAHDIKGQAATFGFPLAAPVAESLCRLLEHTPDMAHIPIDLIDQHVDAIRAITHRNARGDSELTAARLAEKLRHVTEEFLVAENRDRPDYLEQILAPALAPGD